MRDIKFRCWDTYEKCWLRDDLAYKEALDQAMYNPEKRELYILQQFTGLKDKNGKEIYEGDIIESKTMWGEPRTVKGKVIWVDDMAMWKVEEIHPEYNEREYLGELVAPKHPNRSEVIGNIYENPELIQCQQSTPA